MKTKTILAVQFLVVITLSAMGQDRPAGITGPQIERKYDRFKDETTVKLNPQQIQRISRPREELTLSVEATYKGERQVRPKDVNLIFGSMAEHNVYHDEADVIFIIDGKRIKAGTAYMMTALPSPNLVKVTLKLTLPFDTFLEIANGKDVEMQLGQTELKLAEKDIASLRAFAGSVGG
jgi:hypothetical protein